MESGTQKLAEEVAKLIKFIRVCALMAIVGTLCFFLYLWTDYAFPTINKAPKQATKSSGFDFMSLPGARVVEDNELAQETKRRKVIPLEELGIPYKKIPTQEKIFKVRRPSDGSIWDVPQPNLQKAMELGGQVIEENSETRDLSKYKSFQPIENDSSALLGK